MESHACSLDNVEAVHTTDPFAPAHQAFEDLVGKLASLRELAVTSSRTGWKSRAPYGGCHTPRQC